jgi:hypothetical protein
MSRKLVTLVYERRIGSMLRKAVLACMADRANDDGTGVWLSKGRIADEIEASRRAVITAIQEMVSEGILIDNGQRERGSTNDYSLNVPVIMALPSSREGCENLHTPGRQRTKQGVQKVTPPVNPVHTPCEPSSHEPSFNRPLTTEAKASVPANGKSPSESKSTGRVRGIARAVSLPPNWTPNLTVMAYASKNGLSREEINHEADQFRNDAAAKGKRFKDWDAAFRTWIGNTVKWRAERAASSAARTKPGGQSRGGGIFAAGVRAVSEARGYGQPVRDEDDRRRRDDDMGAGHDIDGEFFRITGT